MNTMMNNKANETKSFRKSLKCFAAMLLVAATMTAMGTALADGMHTADVDAGSCSFVKISSVKNGHFTETEITDSEGFHMSTTSATFDDDDVTLLGRRFTETVITDSEGFHMSTTSAEF